MARTNERVFDTAGAVAAARCEGDRVYPAPYASGARKHAYTLHGVKRLVPVEYYLRTNHNAVLTAVLICGHSKRYDVRPGARTLPPIVRCDQCEQQLKASTLSS